MENSKREEKWGSRGPIEVIEKGGMWSNEVGGCGHIEGGLLKANDSSSSKGPVKNKKEET